MLPAIEYIIYMRHIRKMADKKLNPLVPSSNTKDTMDYKALIIQELGVLRMRDSTTPGGHFKVRAYDKVIKQLGAHGPVHSMKDIETIEGIGSKIHDKIKEILTTGGLAAADKARKEHSIDALTAFNKIYGVGPVKAAELVNKYSIESIEELAKHPKLDKILNENQRKGLTYYYDFLERIPRAEMEEHEKIIMDALTPYEAYVVGSYRRGAESSGDIDVIIKIPSTEKDGKTLTNIIDKLIEQKYIIDTLAHGPKKYMGVSRISSTARRLDIIVANEDEFPFAIFYFTGSDKFNVAVRRRAQDRGYSLNEHGFTPAVEGITTEKDIFHFLSMKYVEPANRIDETSIIPCRILRIKHNN